MNRRMVVYLLGWILIFLGGFLLLPFIVGLLYQESCTWWFLLTAALSALVGVVFRSTKPKKTTVFMREGCIVTALGWLFMSIIGALPFYFSGAIPDYIDALFETISGFTTTGASILAKVEPLPYCMLFWRSFTHWIGGMGVLVFLLTVLQIAGGTSINLMRAESPGPSVGKSTPKLKQTARLLYFLYFGLTVLQFILLKCGGMSIFEAITTAFGTAGTGGFGIKNDSLASYSSYIQWVTIIFMILFGVNFNFYSLLFFRKGKAALKIEEMWYYLGIIASAIVIIMFNTYKPGLLFGDHLRQTAFQVASIITTTGFSTIDFNYWPALSKTVLVILMFVGACAGSTGGGIKVSRFVIGFKGVLNEISSYIHPKRVKKIKMEGHVIEDEVIRGVFNYFLTFLIIFVISILLITIENKDLITSFTAVAATINNIGPGLEEVGPASNFGGFTVFSKLILMFDMLAGRLELFPMLLLFHPGSWKGIFSRFEK